MTLVLHPQPSIVVCAIASLLSCGQWDEAIEYARKHNDASSMSDEELAEAVSAFSLLVREESALLVKENVLNPEKWEEAVEIFKLKVEDSEKRTSVKVKMEIGNIILQAIKKVG
ncbi:unnamed protein product [Arabis nemorensis]|uniref:Uncharacterized protein n=1 Tax=Arabis nemorensis TaxID=586526 RepID=A0A565AYW7_9BRAS|nr:unnamed protein product [Arabis nemorensis]